MYIYSTFLSQDASIVNLRRIDRSSYRHQYGIKKSIRDVRADKGEPVLHTPQIFPKKFQLVPSS